MHKVKIGIAWSGLDWPGIGSARLVQTLLDQAESAWTLRLNQPSISERKY